MHTYVLLEILVLGSTACRHLVGLDVVSLVVACTVDVDVVTLALVPPPFVVSGGLFGEEADGYYPNPYRGGLHGVSPCIGGLNRVLSRLPASLLLYESPLELMQRFILGCVLHWF